MSEPIGDDPLERLRRADPLRADGVPSASLDRVRMRVQEAIAAEPRGAPRWAARPRLALGGIGAAVVAVALLASIGSPGAGPGVVPDPSGPPAIASCVEQFSLESLARRDFAFDGTVVSINGENVTFRVDEAFRGLAAGDVTLTATGMTGTAISSAGGPNLVVSGRYLVAGSDRFVWACGFTQDYDASVAATWRQALGD